MYWLRRPPYLRWFGAALILLIGLLMDLRGPELETYPFAAEPIPAGSAVDGAIEWREVGADVLPRWSGPVSGISEIDVAIGDPLLPSLLAEVAVPVDWWSVPLPLPVATAPGTRLRIRQGHNGAFLDGILVETGTDNGYEIVGMVAFPAHDAPKAAAAAADDALVVMVGHEGRGTVPDG